MLDKLPHKILFVEHSQNNTSFLNTVERSGFDVIKLSISSLEVEFLHKIRPSLVIIDFASNKTPIDCMYEELVELINAPFIFLLDKEESRLLSKLAYREEFKGDAEPPAPAYLNVRGDRKMLKNSLVSSFVNDSAAKEREARTMYNRRATNDDINDEYIPNNLISFLIKPFFADQLLALIKSSLRRSKMGLYDKVIKYKHISMDLSTYMVYEKNNIIHLGPTEFKILQLFIQNPTTIFSRQEIIKQIQKDAKVFDHRTIDVHINRIRTALSTDTRKKCYIKTVRSLGYCLDLPDKQN